MQVFGSNVIGSVTFSYGDVAEIITEYFLFRPGEKPVDANLAGIKLRAMEETEKWPGIAFGFHRTHRLSQVYPDADDHWSRGNQANQAYVGFSKHYSVVSLHGGLGLADLRLRVQRTFKDAADHATIRIGDQAETSSSLGSLLFWSLGIEWKAYRRMRLMMGYQSLPVANVD